MAHKMSYYEKISAKNKTSEEVERIKKLFEDNINIANKIASKYYKTKYWDYDEALQIARMGLWKACLIWNPEKYRISTLAYNIINRDFIDFDREQKKQPDILFNLEDNCVTDDLSLNDVLIDEDSYVEEDILQDDAMQELNQDIVYILDDISEDLNISKSIVKIIYLTYVESNSGGELSVKNLNFINKQIVKQVIQQIQERLRSIL